MCRKLDNKIRNNAVQMRELAQKPLISVFILHVRKSPDEITIAPLASEDDGLRKLQLTDAASAINVDVFEERRHVHDADASLREPQPEFLEVDRRVVVQWPKNMRRHAGSISSGGG